jgi:hypothetical protein
MSLLLAITPTRALNETRIQGEPLARKPRKSMLGEAGQTCGRILKGLFDGCNFILLQTENNPLTTQTGER